MCVYSLDGETVNSATGWLSGEQTIPCKSFYTRIVIARETENLSETADIYEFCSAVIIVSRLTKLENRFANYIIVSKDGSGDFTTVTDAVYSASDGDVIYIKKGTYDNEAVKAWGKNISIIGEDEYQTIIKNGFNDYYNPPLEMCKGYLSNLTLHQYDSGVTPPTETGAGYGLHVEDDSMIDSAFTLNNVHCDSDKVPGAGIGLRPGCKLISNNCTFNGRDKGGLFFHDCANGNVGNQFVSFKNCIISTESNGVSMVIHSQKMVGSLTTVEFINNVFSNSAGNVPTIDCSNGTTFVGTATTTYDFYDLVNFKKSPNNFGNNIMGLNYSYN
jgi:aspartate 1-decarboxylase